MFSCNPDSDGKLDTSTEFYQSMFEGQKKRDAAEKYKSDRKSEKKIQKDVCGKFYNFKITFSVVLSPSHQFENSTCHQSPLKTSYTTGPFSVLINVFNL